MKPVFVILVFLPLGAFQHSSTCSDEESDSVRLYNEVTGVKEDGLVQICKSGRWYSVCGSNWDCRDGNVACRELGYDQARSAGTYSGYTFGSWSYKDHVRYSCTGNEDALQNCSTYGYYDCYSYSAGVKCVVASDSCCSNHGSLRLVGGNQENEGVLEYCINERWSPFCSNFQDEEASVACKQLGYSKFAAFIGYQDYDWHNETDYTGSLFNYFSCSSSATENTLNSCSFHSSQNNHYSGQCSTSCLTPVAIRCYESNQCNNGDLRLMDGYISQEGRVEVCVDGVWGSVCASGWTKSSAYVVCKRLGFFNSAPIVYTHSEYGKGDGPIVYSNLQCNGWETSFDQCSKSGYLHFSCSQTAGVLCPDVCNEGDVRLVGGTTADQGVVEVCMNHVWGLISDVGWDKNDAKVVCRQLNYPVKNVMALINSYFGKPDRSIHYSYVLCNGGETSLTSCQKLTHSLKEGRLIYSIAGIAGVSCHEIELRNVTGTPTTPSTAGTALKHTTPTTKIKSKTSDTSCSTNIMKPVTNTKHSVSKLDKTNAHSNTLSSSSASDSFSFTNFLRTISTQITPLSATKNIRPSISNSNGYGHTSSSLDAQPFNLSSDSEPIFMITTVMLICIIFIGVICVGLGIVLIAVRYFYKNQGNHKVPLPAVKMSNIYSTLQNEDDEEETKQPLGTRLQETEKLVFDDDLQA